MSEIDHLLSEAMKLTDAQRAELAHRLLETVSEEDVHAIDPEIDAAWREEVRRRSARLRSGEAKTIPWEETRQRLLSK
jgi:putative addiction module component (TIGR02574 family)